MSKSIITEDMIKGMLITLNKIYWHMSVYEQSIILAKASDIPYLGGIFEMDEKDNIYYLPIKKRDKVITLDFLDDV